MKGILQMQETDRNNGFDVVERELRERSRSLGKELRDTISENA